ncbi:MAG: sodium-dependent transporter [Rhodospirillaceae bacterium]|nr:sodium-dependent transporter [Rhodospirillaceae bacterium]
MTGAKRETWSSAAMFILAAIGGAVGFGSIWRFPYLIGTNGGPAFVIIYIVLLIAITIPLMMAETLMGRRGQGSAPESMTKLAAEIGASPRWSIVGWLGVLGAFMIMTYYSMIGGWVLAYIPSSITDGFAGQTREQFQASWDALMADPARMIFWLTVFMGVTALIVGRGITAGIERAVGFLMPALVIMLVIITVYALIIGDAAKGLAFMFVPDFSKVTWELVLVALGQAFFSIGVGMGMMFTYGAYLDSDVSIGKACITIVVADTIVSLLSGLAIFPIVFGFGLDPAAGPGLVFVTLPLAFGQMPAGTLVGTAFFILLFFAGLASALALTEVPVACLSRRIGWTRGRATALVAFLIWAIGLLCVLSFNELKDYHPLSNVGRYATATLYEIIDDVSANFVLVIDAILIAVFVGFWMKKETLLTELGLTDGWIYQSWMFLTRVVTPIALIVTLIATWV